MEINSIRKNPLIIIEKKDKYSSFIKLLSKDFLFKLIKIIKLN